VAILERNAGQDRKLLSSEKQTHERLNGTFQIQSKEVCCSNSIRQYCILIFWITAVLLGKQWYIQSLQISLVQSLLTLLISVFFIAETNLLL
jgi:hypothetical protein